MQKKVLAVAVSAAMLLVSGAATAQTITNDSLAESGSSLLVGHDGVTIQTDQSFGEVLEALKTAQGLGGYVDALGTGNTLQMPVGGEIYADTQLEELLPALKQKVPSAAGILDRIENATEFTEAGSSLSFSTDIVNRIGDDGHDPLLIGMNAGDVLVNSTTGTLTLDRTGIVESTFESGNAFGVIGGGTAVNLGILYETINGEAGLLNAEATRISNGGVKLDISGHANVGGLSAAGAALALGGTASSTVNGDVSIDITTDHLDGHNTSGAVVGVIAGGMAVSTLDGNASTTVTGTTKVKATNGVNVGVFGGGAALTTELQGIPSRLLGSSGVGIETILQAFVGEDRYVSGGKATANSGNVEMSFTDQSVSVAVAGGGLGVAWSGGGEGSSSEVSVNTGDVDITLGGPGVVEDLKDDLHGIAVDLIGSLSSALQNPSKDAILAALPEVTDAIKQSQDQFRGAHVGTIGGSILVAGMPSTSAAKAAASGETGDVVINITGGYNVATLGGGMTIAYGVEKAAGTSATSTVQSSEISISGGDSVLTMAGGFAYATGSNGIDSTVESISTVKSGTIDMSSGTADGLFGGGLAIDDTAAARTNATAETTTVSISVSGGTVNVANVAPLFDIGEPGADGGNPSSRSYVYETADLVQAVGVAITGGGIATGGGASAHTEQATINLKGGTIDGNVLGGGLATLGGKAAVENVEITVAGAEVKGDIYAGGAAGSEQNQLFDASYQSPSSTVGKAEVRLDSGTVTGDLYAGGYVYQDATDAVATVKDSTVIISSTDVFQGKRIDGNGAGSVVTDEEGVGTAELILSGGDFDFFRESAGDPAQGANTVIAAFDAVDVTGSLTGVNYEFGDKSTTVFTGGPSQIVFTDATLTGRTAQVGSNDKAGFLGATDANANGLGYSVVKGAMGFGSDDVAQKAADAYAEVGSDAVLYVTGEVDLTNVDVLVGSATGTGVQIGENGILIADASGETKVTGDVTLSEKGVYFDNVGVDLAEGATEQTVTFGSTLGDAATSWDNVLWTMDKSADGKTFTFKAENTLGLDGDVYGFYNGLGSDDPLRTLIDSSSYRGEESLRAGMNLAAAAGVQAAAIEGVNQGIDAASRRASLQRTYKDGVEGFAEVTGIYSKMGGSGDMNEIKLEMGGLVAGADYTTGDWTFGGLVNAGTGTVRGQGDNGGVKNEVDYYGFELYGAKRFGDFNLVGQMGYLATTNDLSDGHLGAQVDDLDADVWTVGVRGEMKHALSAKCFVVPYVGLNYLRVGTDGYTTNQGTKVDSADQNLFTMPIGAVFQGTIASASGWNWTPSVDVAYVGSFGDREVDVDTTSVTGTVGAVSMDVWSESVFRARVGLEASKGNFGIGVIAGGSAGSDDASGFFGQIRARYAF